MTKENTGNATQPGGASGGAANERTAGNRQLSDRTASEVHPWKIIQSDFDPSETAQYASIFALGNGYIGIRGAHEDKPLVAASRPKPDGIRGTFLNGFYETSPIEYGESAYGFADTAETMQNIADPLPICLRVDGEVFDIDEAAAKGQLSSFERDLAMSYGQLERKLIWTSSSGKQVRIDSRRLVSFPKTHIACLVYRVTVLGQQSAVIELTSTIDGNSANKHGGDDPRLPRGSHEPTLTTWHREADEGTEILTLGQRTVSSGLAYVVGVSHRSNAELVSAPVANDVDESLAANRASFHYQMTVEPMETIELEKYIAFYDSRSEEASALVGLARRAVLAAREEGYDVLRHEQQEYLDNFWNHAQISLRGDLTLQQGPNFSSFHLLQGAGRDGKTSIPAKGLSGEGYEGHYFWDTEMYMFPFFLYSMPDIAKKLLEYRYSILDQARERALLMGHKRGALFPWRTISGRECSGYFLAGTAQFHINGDVALAVQKYLEATDDTDFLWDMGLEILLETAVFYLDMGWQDPDRGFTLNAVTGPDEYTVAVNNNYYTNLVAKLTMEAAAGALAKLAALDKQRLDKLLEHLGYDLAEVVSTLKLAASTMYFPYSDSLGIPLQDDSYAEREPWDFLGADPAKYPLLLHYHPLVIYRHRVSKQADMLLAEYLRPDWFTYEERKKSFDYYELFTTHDSSLSASAHSIMANWLGKSAKAFDYFMETARLDLDNTHGNTADGLHLANMAGNWLALTAGYAGMLVQDGELYFHPQLPQAWSGYDFRITYKGNLISLRIREAEATYTLLDGPGLTFHHHNEVVTLGGGVADGVGGGAAGVGGGAAGVGGGAAGIGGGVVGEKSKTLPLENVIPADSRREPILAVLFDVDGVLLHSDEEHYQAWKRLADEEGIYFDRAINQRLRGVSRLASLDIILERSAKAYGPEDKEALAERKNNYYKEAIDQLDERALLPGVVPFLESLKARGVKLASASSSKNAPTLLARTGITDYFDVHVNGTDIQHSKPHPQVFSLAAERLGIPPENCLVLEDAEAGIEAGKAAGMRTLAIGHIASRFLELGADSGAFSLSSVRPEDLDVI